MLPLVLVLTVALGAVVVAIAKYATTNLANARVAEDRTYRLAAADGALRVAVDELRSGDTRCIYPGQPVALPGAPAAFNGVSGSVDCTVLEGSATALYRWALAVTGETVPTSLDLISTGGGGDKPIEGLTWVTRVEGSSLSGITAGNKLRIQNAPLVYNAAEPCPAVDIGGSVEFVPTSFGPTCDGTSWQNHAAFDDPPLPDFVVDENPPPDTTESPGCLVYSPGRYTSQFPVVNQPTYFRTGDYYFAHTPSLPSAVGDAEIRFQDVNVQAGSIEPGFTPSVDRSTSPCWPSIQLDQAAADATGGPYGATFYLGGKSHLAVSGGSKLEIMPRRHTGDDRVAFPDTDIERTAYVGIQAICATADWPADSDGDTWCDAADKTHAPVSGLDKSTLPGYVPTNPGNDRSILRIESNAELIVHGAIYAPLHQVRLISSSEVQLVGGVITSRIDIQVPGSNVTIAADTAAVDAGPMLLQLTSRATLDDADTNMQAVVEYLPAEPPTGRVVVDSWRVCDALAC